MLEIQVQFLLQSFSLNAKNCFFYIAAEIAGPAQQLILVHLEYGVLCNSATALTGLS